jgi:hypothetical protein
MLRLLKVVAEQLHAVVGEALRLFPALNEEAIEIVHDNERCKAETQLCAPDDY